MGGMSLPPLVEPAAELTVDEVRRYSRHLIIPDVGMTGQKRLKNAKVLVVGAGGLGSPALLYLAAAGVGTLGIVDFDVVDESNLQRQIIHGQSDVGRSKAESARDSVREINPYVTVNLHEERLDSTNVLELFAQYDLIVDGTDNFATRYLVNDACVLLGDLRGGRGRGQGLHDHRHAAQAVAGHRGEDPADRRPGAERVRDRQHPGRHAHPEGRVPQRHRAGAALPGPADRAALQERH